jgi:membrane associated rhomboid family serine protease
VHELRGKFERFCFRHRDLGIPNLMLFLSVGSLIVYVFSLIDPSNVIYNFLCFNRYKILHGQVWRLITYVLIPSSSSLWLLISLYFYYMIGKMLENAWGTFKFNLFYLSGVVLTDIAALLLGGTASVSDLNLSLFLAFATLYPDNMVLLFFIIPLKMKYLAWVYFALTAATVLMTSFPANLYPIIALLNYFFFFGSDVKNLFSRGAAVHGFRSAGAYRSGFHRKHHVSANADWAQDYRSRTQEKPYHHKCTVCGRTDTDFPDLDFRYCSKCKGYYCYCEDHIQNHIPVQ